MQWLRDTFHVWMWARKIFSFFLFARKIPIRYTPAQSSNCAISYSILRRVIVCCNSRATYILFLTWIFQAKVCIYNSMAGWLSVTGRTWGTWPLDVCGLVGSILAFIFRQFRFIELLILVKILVSEKELWHFLSEYFFTQLISPIWWFFYTISWRVNKNAQFSL